MANIGVWVTNFSSPGLVVNLSSSTGAVLGSYSTPAYPGGLAIDYNKNIWITCYSIVAGGDGYLIKMNSSGEILLNINVGIGGCGYPIIDSFNNCWISLPTGTIGYQCYDTSGNLLGSFSNFIVGNQGVSAPLSLIVNNNQYFAGDIPAAVSTGFFIG